MRTEFVERGTPPCFMKDEREDIKTMKGYFAETGHDSYRLLKQADPKNNEPRMAMKEIRLRFSERQYEKLKSFDGLGLKKKLDVMYAVIDFIVKHVKNGTNI